MKRIKTAVFPVAGFGTRLLPATKAIPKEMITLIDKPLIQYAVEEVIDSGIERIIFITARTKKALEDHFDVNIELNHTLLKNNKIETLNNIKKISEIADIIYVRQKYMLGLGHAVMCARDIVKDEPFAVILPDDFIMSKKPVIKQLIEQFNIYNSPIVALMEVEKQEAHKYGIATKYEKISEQLYKINALIEKPKSIPNSNLAVIGRYILTSEIFDILDSLKIKNGDELQLTDALQKLILTQNIYGYSFEGSRFDCGSKSGLFEASINLALHNPELTDILKKYKLFL